MQRFYETAAFDRVEDGAYRVTLDGREIRTPAKRLLRLPSAALAEAVAAELNGQGEKVDVRSMPLMSLASTAIDRVAPMREQIIDELARYGETDLVCYRAESPDELVRRQQEQWQPLLDWLALQCDAPLRVCSGIVPQAQAPEALAALGRTIAAHDDFVLAAVSSATAATGSLVIALALIAGRIGAEDAIVASQLDEHFQAETWGEDPEAGRRWAALADDIRAAERFAHLARF